LKIQEIKNVVKKEKNENGNDVREEKKDNDKGEQKGN